MALQIKNTSGADGIWVGQEILDGAYYVIPQTDRSQWTDDPDVFTDIAGGNLTVSDGVTDFTEHLEGWKHLEGQLSFPMSDMDSKKIAVHPSYKPTIPGGTTYAVWSGAGDDIASDPSVLGNGPLLHFDMQQGTPIKTIRVDFDHQAFGRVWIHEAYLKFTDGGEGDFVSADVMATGVALQQAANLDLVLDGDLVKYSPSGPGTGTHGFASAPTLLPRTFSKDGGWNYDGINLTPSMDDTGEYNISTVDSSVHRYVNKIPTYGDCHYFSMSSDETAELNTGYYLSIDVHNVSDTNWHLSVIMEIYRERTVP